MRNWSIKFKLLMFTVTTAILLLIVAISGWMAAASIGERLTNVSEQNLPAITNLMRMRTWQLAAISENKTAMSWDIGAYDAMSDKMAAVAEGHAYFGEVLKDKSAADARAQLYFDEYAKLPKTADEAKTWKSLQDEWKLYLESNMLALDKLKSISERGDWDQLALEVKDFRKLNDEIQRSSREIQAQLDTLISLNQTYTKQAMDDGIDAQKRARLLTILVTAMAMLLCVGGAWWLIRSITVPLLAAVKVARRVADGDLTPAVKTLSSGESDEIGQLMRALEDMNGSLQNIVGRIRSGTDTVATAASQIASGNLDLSSRTKHQAASLEKTASSMEELTSTVKQNGDNARQANQLAVSASDVAVKGGQVVSQVVDTMGSISASSSKIVDIISVIDGIAFQTNILALNAAVEAARAGEQGRGFAVVASEVRSLAQRSAVAAKEIKELIGDSVGKVEIGSKLVDQAGTTMREIVASVKRVTHLISEITASSHEQEHKIEQINQAIREMEAVTQQNTSLVEYAASATESLHGQATTLAQAVSVFKLNGTAPTPAEPIVWARATSVTQSDKNGSIVMRIPNRK